MAFDTAIMKSVEQLGYRVTVGDIAADAGIELNQAQQSLLELASVAGGNLQVAESGEIAYLFPRNFRSILRRKHWQMRWKEWWKRVWDILFYLIRISFGIVLIVSVVLMLAAIAIIVITIQSQNEGEGNSGGRSHSGGVHLPGFWFGPDLFWFFDPHYNSRRSPQRKSSSTAPSTNRINFLEAIFSFLFGDGNPNAELEERRWQEIGTVIRNHEGAVIAEQIAPYLDNITSSNQEDENYMLPVLARFNGYPQVSPVGEIIYYFPQLQVTARSRKKQAVATFLRERLWRFSQASSGQIMAAIALGAANFILALMLGSLLRGDLAVQLGGLVGFVASIYWFLLGYGVAFLAIPLLRYFWIQWRNTSIEARNHQRSQRKLFLDQASEHLRQKISYARQFASQKVIGTEDLAYTTETGLLEQEIEGSAQIEEQWQRRLDSSGED